MTDATKRKIALKDPRYARLWNLPGVPVRTPLPCVHEGAVLEFAPCGSEYRHVRDCAVHDRCTRGVSKIHSCRRCPDRQTHERVRIDSAGLIAAPGGRAFNGSLTKFNGKFLLAYRTGWRGSRVAVCEVDPVTGGHGPSTLLNLSQPPGRVGNEDPRLFVYRDQLHVSFTTYEERQQGRGKARWTDQRYARLNPDLSVAEEFAPQYPRRQEWEKNWAFFEGLDGDLYCVYSVSPHVVLRVDGDRTEEAGRTDYPGQWSGGHLRGGCPPVLVNGEFWHWFHGALDVKPNRRYSVGLYAFEPAPPFKVTRWTPEPLAWATESDWKESGNYCRVVFPAGAVLDGETWRVSVGVHDRWLEVWSWDHAAVGAAMGG